MHDPAQDSSRLETALSRANDIVVVDGATFDSRSRKANTILAESGDPAVVASIASAIAPDFTQERMDWMTPGGPTIAFLCDRELLAAIACLNPGWVRCPSLWDGDAPLADEGVALLDALTTFATSTVERQLESGASPSSIAKAVRSKYSLPPARVHFAMRQGGLTMSDAGEATRSTMSEAELAAHVKLNDSLWDVMLTTEEPTPIPSDPAPES